MFLTLLEAPGTRKLAGFENLDAVEMDDDSSEEEGKFDERWEDEDGCEADGIEPNVKIKNLKKKISFSVHGCRLFNQHVGTGGTFVEMATGFFKTPNLV